MNYYDKNRFEVIYKQNNAFRSDWLKMIFVDRETGVNYLWIVSGYAGGLTPLLDADGKPIVTKN